MVRPAKTSAEAVKPLGKDAISWLKVGWNVMTVFSLFWVVRMVRYVRPPFVASPREPTK